MARSSAQKIRTKVSDIEQTDLLTALKLTPGSNVRYDHGLMVSRSGSEGSLMKKVEDYRAHADECRSMANRARMPDEKSMLMNMAATWESLAVDREAHIALGLLAVGLGSTEHADAAPATDRDVRPKGVDFDCDSEARRRFMDTL
jgi:hypothetical protein